MALLTLPLYAMLAHYGLWLRIEQYGLTVAGGEVLISATLAYFAFSYCGLSYQHQQWLIWVHKINVIGCAHYLWRCWRSIHRL